VDDFLIAFDKVCPKACLDDRDSSFNALLTAVERNSNDVASTAALSSIQTQLDKTSHTRSWFADSFLEESINYHNLPDCEPCEWNEESGDCIGGIDRFTFVSQPRGASEEFNPQFDPRSIKITCNSNCAAYAKSLAADEGALMRAPLEAIVECAGGWGAPNSANLHTSLATYVADAWVKCDPTSTDLGFDNINEQADHVCQLGAGCWGIEANCRKVRRFIAKIDVACPRQCDANGENELDVCKTNQPERNSSTCTYITACVVLGIHPFLKRPRIYFVVTKKAVLICCAGRLRSFWQLSLRHLKFAPFFCVPIASNLQVEEEVTIKRR
jgi:hypothetical protein